MKRRFFVLGTMMCFAASAVSAQSAPLRAAFEAMSAIERRLVQVELQLMDLYQGQIDMRFGPMTQSALIMAADLISRRTNGDMTFDLNSAEDARRFLSMMAQEQFMFIYDDGYEG